jgi:hypothetical protein
VEKPHQSWAGFPMKKPWQWKKICQHPRRLFDSFNFDRSLTFQDTMDLSFPGAPNQSPVRDNQDTSPDDQYNNRYHFNLGCNGNEDTFSLLADPPGSQVGGAS